MVITTDATTLIVPADRARTTLMLVNASEHDIMLGPTPDRLGSKLEGDTGVVLATTSAVYGRIAHQRSSDLTVVLHVREAF